MTTRPLVRADLVTGIVLMALGLAVLAESYAMPRLEERSINPWTAPGLVPGLLGIIITVLGGVLALRSLAAGALRPRANLSYAEVQEARAALGRLLLCLALCLSYAVILVGKVPFWLATSLFVFVFIVAFEWRREDRAGARLVKVAVAGALAGAAMLVVPYVFETLFLVRLP
jgi:putative tricarboxylic transport membrane protein